MRYLLVLLAALAVAGCPKRDTTLPPVEEEPPPEPSPNPLPEPEPEPGPIPPL